MPKKIPTYMRKFVNIKKLENNIPLIRDKDYNFNPTLCIIHKQVKKTYIDPIEEYNIPPTLRIIHGNDF